MTVLAATTWKNNAEMIRACVALNYLSWDDRILDPTYGKGNWWKSFGEPPNLYHGTHDDWDFRELPFADGMFDVVTFDPPYVSPGGRSTSTIKSMHNAYGMDDAPTSPQELQQLINDGLTEMYRVVRKRGIVMVKCQDYVSSGKLWMGTHWTLSYALKLRFECVDRLEHIGNPRPQPEHRRQVHARRNLSTLFVLRK